MTKRTKAVRTPILDAIYNKDGERVALTVAGDADPLIEHEEQVNGKRLLTGDWIDALDTESLSKQTQLTYARGATSLVKWLHEHGRPTYVEGVERRDVKAWLHDLKVSGCKPPTIRVYYRAVVLMFAHAAHERLIPDSAIVAGIAVPSAPAPVTPVLEPEEIESLLQATKGPDFHARRNHALIRVMLATGFRRTELTTMTIDDVNLDGVGWIADQQGPMVRCTVSKTKPRMTYIDAKTARALKQYLRARDRYSAGKRTNALWIGQRGAMTADTLYDVIVAIGKQAGIEGLHPHTFRHTWAHLGLDAGIPLDSMVYLGGWSNMRMLDRYGVSKRQSRALNAQLAVLNGQGVAA